MFFDINSCNFNHKHRTALKFGLSMMKSEDGWSLNHSLSCCDISSGRDSRNSISEACSMI